MVKKSEMTAKQKYQYELRKLEGKLKNKQKCLDPAYQLTKAGKPRKFCEFYDDEIYGIENNIRKAKTLGLVDGYYKPKKVRNPNMVAKKAVKKRVPRVPKEGRAELTYRYNQIDRNLGKLYENCANDVYAAKHPKYCIDRRAKYESEIEAISKQRKALPAYSRKGMRVISTDPNWTAGKAKMMITAIAKDLGVARPAVAEAYKKLKRRLGENRKNESKTRKAIADYFGSNVMSGSGLVGGCGTCGNCGYEN